MAKQTQALTNEQSYEDARTKALAKIEADLLKKSTAAEKKALQNTKVAIEQTFDSYAKQDGKLYQADLMRNGRDAKLRESVIKGILESQTTKTANLTKQLEKVLQDEYMRELYKYEINDLKPKISALKKSDLKELLNDAWYGETYTKTLKDHAANLEKKIYQTILLNTQGGVTKQELMPKVQKLHEQNVYNTQRVNQTEIARKKNQAHLQALKDAGVPTVGMKWIATLSERTCAICRAFDGKIYDVKEIPANPAHPLCRCALVSVPEDERYARRVQGSDGSWKVIDDDEYVKWMKDTGYKEDFIIKSNYKPKETTAVKQLNANDAYIKQLDAQQAYKHITKKVKMTEAQADAIEMYTTGSYEEINEGLRNGKVASYYEKTVKNLDALLDKIPTAETKTYRYLDFASYNKDLYEPFLEQHQKGNIVTYKGYTSTTTQNGAYSTAERKGEISITIYGKNGKDIANYSYSPDEKEILFKRDTSFIVYDRKENKNGVIDLILLEV